MDSGDAVFEEVGGLDGDVGAPAEDPAFDFFEGVEAQVQEAGAVGKGFDELGGMPFAGANEVGSPGIEVKGGFDARKEVPGEELPKPGKTPALISGEARGS